MNIVAYQILELKKLKLKTLGNIIRQVVHI